MSADQLIRAAMDAGVVLAWDGGKVKARGKTDAIKSMLAQLRQHKAEIEQHLRPPEEPAPPAVIAQAAALIERIRLPWHHTDAGWRETSQRYYQHHVNCKTCQSAGQGRGQRCDAGLQLWNEYETTFLKATP